MLCRLRVYILVYLSLISLRRGVSCAQASKFQPLEDTTVKIYLFYKSQYLKQTYETVITDYMAVAGILTKTIIWQKKSVENLISSRSLENRNYFGPRYNF